MIERATIVRVDGRRVWVEVPRLGVGVRFGPLEVATDQALAVGGRCLVGYIHGTPDDLVVLGIIS